MVRTCEVVAAVVAIFWLIRFVWASVCLPGGGADPVGYLRFSGHKSGGRMCVCVCVFDPNEDGCHLNDEYDDVTFSRWEPEGFLFFLGWYRFIPRGSYTIFQVVVAITVTNNSCWSWPVMGILFFYSKPAGCFQKYPGIPKWMVYNGKRKTLLKWMIWGGTIVFGNTQLE